MAKKILSILAFVLCLAGNIRAIDHVGATSEVSSGNSFALIENGVPAAIAYDSDDLKGVGIAVGNLLEDFRSVSGRKPATTTELKGERLIVIGSLQSKFIKQLEQDGKLNTGELKGKNEKYVISFIQNPTADVKEMMVIAGSDRRGTIYGTYELSEQIGVSPWYWWADVPTIKRSSLYINKCVYTAGEPAVKYRGIFLNDEAPCLTGWVKHYFNTNYGGKEFYKKVFELILRLRGNFLWPAMWGWAFYADDPENGKTADEMGVIIGTSHHEPMARNHQEWARHRNEYGAWNYQTNQKTIDQFFTEGIRRMKGTEDVVTIGMRGDGDEAMSEDADVKLLEKIIRNQRKIIEKETRRPAKETPQVWALYKEVLDYYDKGLKVPDDVILLLCDDNWGNVRRLPNKYEGSSSDKSARLHPGGYGMYYHVDYVGAPRNSKWLNVTPTQNMWEQLTLTYEYGVDKLWILNVGDLKPMEYPITLFMDMAWRPNKYSASTLLDHTREFCAQQFGEQQAEEAARILNLYSKYAGRSTAEMLDHTTYNIETGEWKQVRDEFLTLETAALRQYVSLPEASKDAYKQLILFPVQAMANIYDMYYSVAMNHKLHAEKNPACNLWADRTEAAFQRDAALADDYNNKMAGGKWKNMMTQKHIGYKTWNDNFPKDVCPEVFRLEGPKAAENRGGYSFEAENGVVVMEAEHFYSATDAKEAKWTVIPDMGRTLSAVTLMPRQPKVDGAKLQYRVKLPAGTKTVKAHVVVKSTLAFSNLDGHRYSVGFEGSERKVVNFNCNLNEKPENIYSIYYPTVARRVVENEVELPIPQNGDLWQTLEIQPLDPGVVFEKIVLDLGGYQPSFLFMNETAPKRK